VKFLEEVGLGTEKCQLDFIVIWIQELIFTFFSAKVPCMY